MTNSGQLSFGVYDGATHVVTSPASYNDGNWAPSPPSTFSAGTGMRLDVDGALVGRDTTSTVAQNFAGYWRIGYDNVNTWPSQPSSYHFAGSLAHAAVYGSVLAGQVSGLWTAAPWSCTSAAGSSGAAADLYWPLQEDGGTVATDAGTVGAAGNGTYASSGLTYGRTGPNCGTGANGAVRFERGTGQVWTMQTVANPQSFTVQTWFQTSTPGGKLIGFGNGTGGALSSSYDRHVYMSSTGQLSFGVYNGGYVLVTTPGGYADGAWHLVTGTFSVDRPGPLRRRHARGQQHRGHGGAGLHRQLAAGRRHRRRLAELDRVPWFTGRLAHASVTYRVLTADEVAGQYLAGK